MTIVAYGDAVCQMVSPSLRLGEYSPIITSPPANNCQLLLYSKTGKVIHALVNIIFKNPSQ